MPQNEDILERFIINDNNNYYYWFPKEKLRIYISNITRNNIKTNSKR